jgi:pyruvate ferredoxin oxidoreductase alpha subunit
MEAVCVLDRVDSFGAYGPMFTEITASLQPFGSGPRLINRIYGLGGRDYLPEHAHEAIEAAAGAAAGRQDIEAKAYIGVRQ